MMDFRKKRKIIGICLLICFGITLISTYFLTEKNYASEITTGIDCEPLDDDEDSLTVYTVDCQEKFDSSDTEYTVTNVYVSRDAKITLSLASGFDTYRTSFSGDAVKLSEPVSFETPVTLFLSNAEDTEEEKIYSFIVDKEVPRITETFYDQDAGWYYQVSATDDGSGVNAVYYSSDGSLDTVESIKESGEVYENDILLLEETNEPIQYYAYAIDNVGNFSKKELSKKDYIDWTAPDISETYESYVFSEQGIYYYNNLAKGKVVYTATYTDNLSETVNIHVKNENTLQFSEISRKGKTASFNGVIANNLEDGIYYVTSSADDGRNNRSQNYTSNAIVLDTVAPVITDIKINDEPYIADDKAELFNEEITFSFKIVDENIETVSVTCGGEMLSVVEGEDGIYTGMISKEILNSRIRIDAKDKAQNSASYLTDNISVDLTAPEVESLLINNQDVFHGKDCIMNPDIIISGAISDAFFDNATFKMDLIKNGLSQIIAAGADYIVANGTVNSFTVRKNGLNDGIYSLKISGMDIGKRAVEYTSNTFIVDGTDPVLTAVITDGPSYVPSSQSRKHSKVLTLVIEEMNPNLENMIDFLVEVVDSQGNAIPDISYSVLGKEYHGAASSLNAAVKASTMWEKTGNKYSLNIEFLTEGNYTISNIVTKDKAENVSETLKRDWVIDGTAPVIDELAFDHNQNKHTDYRYISNRSIGISVTASDFVSKIESVEVNYKIDGKNTVIYLNKQADGSFSYRFGEQERTKGIIDSLIATDSQGNRYEQTMGDGIIVDREAEDIEMLKLAIQDDTSQYKSNVYNKDINLALTVQDTFSGLGEVEYSLNKQTFNTDYSESENLVYEFKKADVVLRASKENEGESIVVGLSAADNAGNLKNIQKTYTIDITKPQISVEFDNNNVINGKYYDENRTATITIKDRHLDLENTEVTITKDGKASKAKVSFSTTDSETYVGTYVFNKDGDYTLQISADDLAGNSSTYLLEEQFTIDKTKPVMTISFDNNNVTNGKYYASGRIATITVKEHNFDEKKVLIDCLASLQGAEIESPKISRFQTDGDIHTATIQFDRDGDYTFSVSLTDLAGNSGSAGIEESFTIDTTKPTIEIVNLDSNQSYNGTVAPAVRIEDINFDASGVVLSLSGAKHGKVNTLGYSINESSNGGIYTYKDFEYDKKTDDYYTLDVQVRDLAGNMFSDSISFKVNRFGSVYVLDSYTQDAITQYYTNASRDFVITEYNVDEVLERDLYYSKDGNVSYLKEGESFEVSHDVDKDFWNIYTYRIGTEELQEDGIYTFTLYSRDSAGNEMDTKTNDIDFTICVDKTDPTIVITGIEDGEIYEEPSKDIILDITDNIALDKVHVYLNDKLTEYTTEDLDDDKITLSVKESNKTQTLKVIAYDMAGNSVDTGEDIRFTISTSKLVTSTASGIIVKSIIAVILLIGVITIILIWYKKSNKEEEK